MAYKIVILAGKNQSPEQIKKIKKSGFSSAEVLFLESAEGGIAEVLQVVERFKENIRDDTLFITLADLETGDRSLVEGIEVEKYFDSLAKKTGKKKIAGIITSVKSGSKLITHGIEKLNSDIENYGITIQQNADFVIEIADQIKKGRDIYDSLFRAFMADGSADASERKEEKKEQKEEEKKERKKEEKKERKVEVSTPEIIPSSKPKVDKSDKFKLEIYKAEQNKESKDEKKSSVVPPPPKPYKVVILIGADHPKQQIEEFRKSLREQGVLEEEILILGDGQKDMGNVVQEVGKYKDHFTDDTVYITWGHGNTGKNGHYIDDIYTSEISQQLKKQTGRTKIKTAITSCQVSGFLKRNEVPQDVSVLTRRGVTRNSKMHENAIFIASLTALITQGKSLEKAYGEATQDEVGSFYFVPLIPLTLEDKKEEKDQASLTEKEKLAKIRETRGIKKINRVGKFSREFLIKFAEEELGEAGEDLIREIEKEEYRHKTHFGLDKIKSIMGIVTKRDESKEGGIKEIITPEKYANFLLKLRGKLQEQVTEENIAQYLKKRSEEFFRTSKSQSSRKSLMFDYLIMASEYGLEEEVRAVLRNDPTLIDIDNDDFTPLMSAAYKDKVNIIELLLDSGAKINYAYNTITALYQAADNGHLASVRLLLERGAKVNATTLDSNTAFQYSAESGNIEIAKLLAKQQAPSQLDLEIALKTAIENGHLDFALYCILSLPGHKKYKDKNGHEVLQIAAIGGHVSFIEKYMDLVAKEEGEEQEKNQQKELLKFAVYNCKEESLKKLLLLIEPDIVFELAREDANFLTFLAQINDIKKIKLLLKKGINLDIVNGDGQNAMMFAAAYGHTELTELLINQGKSPEEINNRRRIALLFASAHGKIETVKALTAKMTLKQINELNDREGNAADVAAAYGHADILNFLLSKETRAKSLESKKIIAFFHASDYRQYHLMQQLGQDVGWDTILVNIIKYNRPNNLELIFNLNPDLKTPENIFKLLLTAIRSNALPSSNLLIGMLSKDQLNITDPNGNTAIHICTAVGNLEIAKLLIAKGINLSHINKEGENAFDIAIKFNHPDFILLAIKSIPDFELHHNIFKLLETAIKSNSVDCAKVLIEFMTLAIANTINEDGNTALHLCIIEGKLEIAKLLLAKKVDLTLVNKEGKSALDLALGNGQYQFVLEILKTGKCDWERFCLVMPVEDISTTPESAVAYKKLWAIRQVADDLNKILGKDKLFPKKLSLEDLNKIFAIVAANKDYINLLDTIGKPQENESILSRCLLHCKDKAVIQKLSDNLDLFITRQNLFGNNNVNLPVRIAIKQAFKEPAFNEIVGKLAARMESADPSFKFDLEFQAKDIRTGWLGKKSAKMNKMKGAIEDFSDIAEGDFKSREKESEEKSSVKGRKKSVTVITGTKLKQSKAPVHTP